MIDGHPPPSYKKGRVPSPIFGLCLLLWPNCCMDQDGTWHVGRPWSSPHCARWGHSSPPQKGGQSCCPQFSAQLYCGQMAGFIKMPLGMEVGLSPGDCVRWGSTPHFPKRVAPPIFGPRLLWPNGCMDQDAAWCGGRRRPTRHCVRWGPSSPSQKRGGASQCSAHVYCG